ncbi:hypothetical protein RZO50_13710 [Microbacterium sp. SSW1-59]|uniref:hypothetical protein n=1 Tax=Microbacterium xanthum TaxID=3079794 RepID=UPI002AD336AC|nr:hypothetical protein [Microbacterium sp. SSW1-59]MDZ8202571.1 hypothetical protein [Microbacterium sp. SSW1-59]
MSERPDAHDDLGVSMRIIDRLVPLTALTAGSLLVLSGCFANPLEQLIGGGAEDAVERIIEEQTGTDIDLDTGGGADIPDGWPDLPLPAGDLVAAYAVDGTFSLVYAVEGEAAAESLIGALEGQGFESISSGDVGDLKTVLLQTSEWTVNVGWGLEDGDAVSLSYTAFPTE